MGYISVISSKEIEIDDPKAFAMISKLASNIEVYKRTGVGVQINLTYHGLTTPIE